MMERNDLSMARETASRVSFSRSLPNSTMYFDSKFELPIAMAVADLRRERERSKKRHIEEKRKRKRGLAADPSSLGLRRDT